MVTENIYDKSFRVARNLPSLDRPIFCEDAETGYREWLTECSARMWWASPNFSGSDQSEPEKTGEFRLLHDLLLSIGGVETVFPDIEEDMDSILNRGRFYRGTSKLMRGKDCACHQNTCYLWEANRADHDVSIATGYALSPDGFWRQHSWLVHRYQTPSGQHRTRIVETTVKRLAYFGFEMSDDEAQNFCYDNLL